MAVKKNQSTGLWDVQVWYHDVFAKRKHTTKVGFKTKKEALAWEKQFHDKQHTGKLMFSKVIKDYIAHLSNQQQLGNLKESTVFGKVGYIHTYIEPYFKDMAVEDISSTTVETWLVKVNKTPRKKSGRLSTGTLSNIRTLLGSMFKFARSAYGYKDNPVQDVPVPRTKFSNDTRAEVFKQEHFDIFYASLKRTVHKVFFKTLWYTGLRKSEALYLLAEDLVSSSIDGIPFHALNVTKGYVRLSDGTDVFNETTKNKYSKRLVPIPAHVYEMLASYIKEQNIKPGDRLFPVKPTNVGTTLNWKLQKLGLPHVSLHTFRHTFASTVLDDTKDAVLTAKLLGHSNPTTLYRHYAHLLSSATKDYVVNLEK